MADAALLVGRIALVVLFLFSGYGKLTGLDGTAAYVAAKGLPAPQVLGAVSGVVEIVAAALIIAGWQTRYAAVVLALFTLVATPIFHDYWNLAPPQRMGQYLNFWKNVAMFGGLLVLAGSGAGALSLDGGGKGSA